MVYDESGTPLSGGLGYCAVARASDLPALVVAETRTPLPDKPLGTKGAGESGTVGAPRVLANAVIKALVGAGVEARQIDFPLTAEEGWRLAQSSSG
jgi:carbon-monoxide dehydrogenase large subunit